MAVEIIQRPSKIVYASRVNGTLTSNYVASHNPIIYEFKSDDITDSAYRIEVQIVINSETVSTQEMSPFPNGRTIFYANPIVKKYLEANIFIPTLEGNAKQGGLMVSFQIRYKEIFSDSETNYVTDPNTINVVLAAKQYGDEFGGNMGEYVPFYESSHLHKSRFMSEFEQPIMFKDYPFFASLILEDTEDRMIIEKKDFDINKKEQNTNSVYISTNNGVNIVRINPADSDYLSLTLKKQNGSDS